VQATGDATPALAIAFPNAFFAALGGCGSAAKGHVGCRQFVPPDPGRRRDVAAVCSERARVSIASMGWHAVCAFRPPPPVPPRRQFPEPRADPNILIEAFKDPEEKKILKKNFIEYQRKNHDPVTKSGEIDIAFQNHDAKKMKKCLDSGSSRSPLNALRNASTNNEAG
jgi:hypothetical protein